jgi:4-hydroxy-3-polyprenylbenzoate decarboxylase
LIIKLKLIMAFCGLTDFIAALEKEDELRRISSFVDPVLEITEITDRVTKSDGKALLFQNNGTDFSVLINGYGSDKRMAMALGRKNLDDIDEEITSILSDFSNNKGTLLKKLSVLPSLFRLAGFLPSKLTGKGICQQVVHKEPDLGILPILKCWPHDGGRFITLPIVHTVHPETGKTNAGMYRMQVLDKCTTAMHWQRHKTGAAHFEAWKKAGRRMPVSVALGGDPVYAYSATAPLPENIDEYILAGFLRKKRVKMVRCLTNELFVPCDADIVIEGFVDPAESLFWEGPFGDHTGFYSLADWYPKFHVTCITHSKNAVYPATIVGIPPQEDSWLAKATENIFLSPVKMTLQPEVVDFHMPDAGVAHNLVIVKIKKSYPGQGMKVINSLFGAGQMMFTKYLVVVSDDIDIRNYKELLVNIFGNVDFNKDLLFTHGPLDVLDHSADSFSFGGKVGVDATKKLVEENAGRKPVTPVNKTAISLMASKINSQDIIRSNNLKLFDNGIPILIISVERSQDVDVIDKVRSLFTAIDPDGLIRLIITVDHTVDTSDLFQVAWQVLGNSDPQRDHYFITQHTVLIDGTIKAYRKGGFSRKWPNIVCSDVETISAIDQKWQSLGIGVVLQSPSVKNLALSREGKDEIVVKKD